MPIRAHPNAEARFLSCDTLPREPVSEAVPRSSHPFCSMQLIKEAEKAFNVGPKSDDDGDDAE